LERVQFVEETVNSALKGLLPDVKNEEQRKLMESAIKVTGKMLEFLQRREEKWK
jgi:hypothetical protein